MKNTQDSLFYFITKRQFEQKGDMFSFLSTKKALLLFAIGLYGFATGASDSGAQIKHLIFSLTPFVLLFILYNRTRLKQKDVISSNDTNPSLFNRFLAKAIKYAAKNP